MELAIILVVALAALFVVLKTLVWVLRPMLTFFSSLAADWVADYQSAKADKLVDRQNQRLAKRLAHEDRIRKRAAKKAAAAEKVRLAKEQAAKDAVKASPSATPAPKQEQFVRTAADLGVRFTRSVVDWDRYDVPAFERRPNYVPRPITKVVERAQSLCTAAHDAHVELFKWLLEEVKLIIATGEDLGIQFPNRDVDWESYDSPAFQRRSSYCFQRGYQPARAEVAVAEVENPFKPFAA